ncbi:MAG TPA: DinB family protein [Candidatus Dormibacteraeota bacterium]
MSDPSPRSSPAELIAGLRRTPAELVELTERMGASGTAEGWSPAEVLAHLAHFEVLAGARVRMVLTLERPPLAAFDQEDFNRRFADALPAAEALELFAVNRRATCDLLERLEPADWERPGLHPTRGEEPLAKTVAMLLRHDRDHLEQFRGALRA